MSSRILFVGRQPENFAALWRHLATSQVDVVFAASQNRAARALAEAMADVIVLDASTLRAPAEQMSRSLRQQAPAAHLILITADNSVAGYSFDIQLKQPLDWRRLLESIEEELQKDRRQVLTAGPFVLHLPEQTVLGPAGESRLTPKQFGLLELLMRHTNQVVPRQKIMEVIWQTGFLDDTRTLDVHVSWLRRAIEPDPRKPIYLVTLRGTGYIFCSDGVPPPATLDRPRRKKKLSRGETAS